jgi:pSer/pThr/pTyr-binding forkhead associated (FHA) protein
MADDTRVILKKVSDGQEIPIAGLMIVGRAEDSTLRLMKGQPSRRHAQITTHDSVVFVEDLGSVNGTFVNDRRIDANVKVQLNPGDRLRFDTEEFVFPDSARPEALEQTMPRGADAPAAEEKKKLPGSFLEPSGKQTVYLDPKKRAARKGAPSAAAPETHLPGDIPYLSILSADGSSAKVELSVAAETTKTWNIGSQDDRDIRLNEAGVSAIHAKLKHDKNAWLLSDDLSANGTCVNGEKILTRYLCDGDRLQFGPVECVIRIPPRGETQKTSPPSRKKILIAAMAFVLTLALIFVVFKLAAAQAAPAPCSLLTAAQVGAVVGASVAAGQPIGTTGCAWSAPHLMITLSLGDASGWQKMKAPLAGMTKTALAGLGDDAYFSTGGSAGKQLATLTVKKGRTAYIFHVYGGAVADQMSMEEALAGDVLAKL